MDLKQLNFFITIVDEGSITSASKKLHIAQPSLSNQLKILEEEFGAKLLDRGPRKIVLTDAGKMLYIRAKHILELAKSTLKEINDHKNGFKGTLRIGITETAASTLINGKISDFSRNNPQIKFELHEGITFKITELLFSGIIEVGFVRTLIDTHFLDTHSLDIQYWDIEPMIALYNSDYNFPNDTNTVKIDDLRNRPITVIRSLDKLVTQACWDAGFKPYIYCLNDYLQINLLLATAGLGIAIVPSSALNLLTNENIKYKIIDEPSLFTRNATITVKDRYLSSVSKKFLEQLHI